MPIQCVDPCSNEELARCFGSCQYNIFNRSQRSYVHELPPQRPTNPFITAYTSMSRNSALNSRMPVVQVAGGIVFLCSSSIFSLSFKAFRAATRRVLLSISMNMLATRSRRILDAQVSHSLFEHAQVLSDIIALGKALHGWPIDLYQRTDFVTGDIIDTKHIRVKSAPFRPLSTAWPYVHWPTHSLYCLAVCIVAVHINFIFIAVEQGTWCKIMRMSYGNYIIPST